MDSAAIRFLNSLGIDNVRLDRERGVGRGRFVQVGEEAGERYDQLCGQCWKGNLCVTSGGDVFPCVFARATPLGNARAGLRDILQTSTLIKFRSKVREMDTHRTEARSGDAGTMSAGDRSVQSDVLRPRRAVRSAGLPARPGMQPAALQSVRAVRSELISHATFSGA